MKEKLLKLLQKQDRHMLVTIVYLFIVTYISIDNKCPDNFIILHLIVLTASLILHIIHYKKMHDVRLLNIEYDEIRLKHVKKYNLCRKLFMHTTILCLVLFLIKIDSLDIYKYTRLDYFNLIINILLMCSAFTILYRQTSFETELNSE